MHYWRTIDSYYIPEFKKIESHDLSPFYNDSLDHKIASEHFILYYWELTWEINPWSPMIYLWDRSYLFVGLVMGVKCSSKLESVFLNYRIYIRADVIRPFLQLMLKSPIEYSTWLREKFARKNTFVMHVTMFKHARVGEKRNHSLFADLNHGPHHY